MGRVVAGWMSPGSSVITVMAAKGMAVVTMMQAQLASRSRLVMLRAAAGEAVTNS